MQHNEMHCLFICLSVYLSVCLSVCLSVLFPCLFGLVCLFVFIFWLIWFSFSCIDMPKLLRELDGVGLDVRRLAMSRARRRQSTPLPWRIWARPSGAGWVGVWGWSEGPLLGDSFPQLVVWGNPKPNGKSRWVPSSGCDTGPCHVYGIFGMGAVGIWIANKMDSLRATHLNAFLQYEGHQGGWVSCLV